MKPSLLFSLLLLPGLAARGAAQTGLDVRLAMAKDAFLTGEPLVFILTVQRVIPWYAALLRQPGRTDDKGQAIAALEKFTGSDAAFELLKNELTKPGELRDRVARAIANFTTKPATALL